MTLAKLPDDGMIQLYDRLAPVYDSRHRRWLRYAGGEAQAALEAAVRVAMTADTDLLDAGCGTGRFARGLIADGIRPDRITLLDPSDAMLLVCSDLPVRRLQGRLETIPCASASFDIVTSAWAVETVSRPDGALHELCRVLRPGGVLCLAFCARKPSRGIVDWAMCRSHSLRRTDRFLDINSIRFGLERTMRCDVTVLPTEGPATTLIARKLGI